jgi:hypothetical protein
VTRARESLSAAPTTAAPVAESHDHRDFVRHYLRFLSVQAVGRFEQAIGRLARGLDILGKRTTAMQTRLARTEQDVLLVAAVLERVRETPLEIRTLAERLARVEAQLTASSRDGADAEFMNAAARQLRDVVTGIDAREGLALAPVSPDWMATLAGAGLSARCVHLARARSQPASHAPEACLADVAAGSVDIVAAVGAFETLSPADARTTLDACRRALRPGGALFVLLDTTPAHSRPAFLERLDERVNDPNRLAALVHEAGFDRLVERSLHSAWPSWRTLTARSV